MSKPKKREKDINPEILYEQRKQRERQFYENMGEFRLFPEFLAGNAVSSTESTGLIQVAPVTPEILEAFDNLYSYRQSETYYDNIRE